MQVIKSLIESYFRVVRKTFIDMVPKTIMFFLVNHVKDAMQNELVSELYKQDHDYVSKLMMEAEDVAQRRTTCEEMRDLLGKALEIVNEGKYEKMGPSVLSVAFSTLDSHPLFPAMISEGLQFFPSIIRLRA